MLGGAVQGTREARKRNVTGCRLENWMLGAPDQGKHGTQGNETLPAAGGPRPRRTACVSRSPLARPRWTDSCCGSRVCERPAMEIYDSFDPNAHARRMFLLENGLELPKVDADLLGMENRRPPYTTVTAVGSYGPPCPRRSRYRPTQPLPRKRAPRPSVGAECSPSPDGSVNDRSTKTKAGRCTPEKDVSAELLPETHARQPASRGPGHGSARDDHLHPTSDPRRRRDLLLSGDECDHQARRHQDRRLRSKRGNERARGVHHPAT